jgi:hypothetical protein
MYAQSNANNMIRLLSMHTTRESEDDWCLKRMGERPVIITCHQLRVSTPATAAPVGPTRCYLQSVGVGGTIASTRENAQKQKARSEESSSSSPLS